MYHLCFESKATLFLFAHLKQSIMEKITIKELVEFGRKSDKSKKRFAHKLKTRALSQETKKTSSGGDYWITSTSCILRVLKTGKKELYDQKIEELLAKMKSSNYQISKVMFQRNIDILTRFSDIDLDLLSGNGYKIETVSKQSQIMHINGFFLYVNPKFVFSFDLNGEPTIGSIWLITKLDGYSKSEVGLFCEMLYRFLVLNHGENHHISEEHCIVIETFSGIKMKHSELSSGRIPFRIDNILREIKNL